MRHDGMARTGNGGASGLRRAVRSVVVMGLALAGVTGCARTSVENASGLQAQNRAALGPRPRGQPGGAAQATRSVIALPSLSLWTVAVAELDDVDNDDVDNGC